MADILQLFVYKQMFKGVVKNGFHEIKMSCCSTSRCERVMASISTRIVLPEFQWNFPSIQ